MKIYPEKDAFLGSFVQSAEYSKEHVDIAKNALLKSYEAERQKHEHEQQKSWCRFFEPIFIENRALHNDFLRQSVTIGIKWRVSGRAFYIKRNFREEKKLQPLRFPNKKSVPKKLRGKIINVKKREIS